MLAPYALKGGAGGSALTVAVYTAAELAQMASDAAAANADKVPGAADQARQMAQDASNAVQRASQGGNTGDPGGLDPNRWGSNYTQNYEKYYNVGRDPDYNVHHILPQRFGDILAKANINVDDPRWLREVLKLDTGNGVAAHQRLYTDAWDTWARELGRDPSANEIIDFAKQLESQYATDGTLFYREGDNLPGLVDWNALQQLIQTGQ